MRQIVSWMLASFSLVASISTVFLPFQIIDAMFEHYRGNAAHPDFPEWRFLQFGWAFAAALGAFVVWCFASARPRPRPRLQVTMAALTVVALLVSLIASAFYILFVMPAT